MTKSLFWFATVLLLGTALLFGAGTGAAEGTTRSSISSGKSTPGVEAAQAISTITGVAISPLLGVSGVGAWKYFHTAPAKRAKLPWYAQPWFWVPAMLVVLLAFVKDTFGTALPTAVKKPFDVAEAIENKISGLVAAGAFVPLIAAIFTATGGDDGAFYSNAGLAMVNLTPLLNVLTVPFAIVAFVVVWMVSHVINVLILISPFTTVDAALKSARLFLLSTVAGTAFLNPYVGAVWSLIIILVCFLLVGWSFRLMIFGSVFTWDMLTLRKTRFTVDPEKNWVFTAREIGKTPIRTYGKLSRGEEGQLVLRYRPWLILPRRSLTLPPGKYAVGRGLFYSEIIQVDAREILPAVTLPPRYRTHEEELSSFYGLAGVQDVGAVKGCKALWSWLKELFGFQPEPVPA
jgi:hypothetical protein